MILKCGILCICDVWGVGKIKFWDMRAGKDKVQTCGVGKGHAKVCDINVASHTPFM